MWCMGQGTGHRGGTLFAHCSECIGGQASKPSVARHGGLVYCHTPVSTVAPLHATLRPGFYGFNSYYSTLTVKVWTCGRAGGGRVQAGAALGAPTATDAGPLCRITGFDACSAARARLGAVQLLACRTVPAVCQGSHKNARAHYASLFLMAPSHVVSRTWTLSTATPPINRGAPCMLQVGGLSR